MIRLHSRETKQAGGPVIGGFTLIEVLIGVLVLGLGLLGVAAVFPVVVRQQRVATETVVGLSVERSAESYLRAHTGFNESMMPGGSWRVNMSVWDKWRREQNRSRMDYITSSGTVSGASRWEVPYVEPNGTAADRGTLYPVGKGGLPELRVPLRDRLWRLPYSDRDANASDERYGNEPRYVWDLAWRRIDLGSPTVPDDDNVQIAVFVRRVDASIRVARASIADPNDPLRTQRPTRTTRMSDVLISRFPSDPVPAADRRVPVAVEASGPSAGLPTLNGQGNYGNMFTVRVARVTDEDGDAADPSRVLRRFELDTSAPAMARRLARQLNQKLVDTLGNVYTVVRLDDDNPDAFFVDPPAPAGVGGPEGRAARGWFDVLTTPQVAASAGVFTVKP